MHEDVARARGDEGDLIPQAPDGRRLPDDPRLVRPTEGWPAVRRQAPRGGELGRALHAQQGELLGEHQHLALAERCLVDAAAPDDHGATPRALDLHRVVRRPEHQLPPRDPLARERPSRLEGAGALPPEHEARPVALLPAPEDAFGLGGQQRDLPHAMGLGRRPDDGEGPPRSRRDRARGLIVHGNRGVLAHRRPS